MDLTGTDNALPTQATTGNGIADDAGWDKPAGWANKAATPPDAQPEGETKRTLPRPVNMLLDPLSPEDGGDEGPEGEAAGAPGAQPSPYAPVDYEFAFPEGFAPDEGLVNDFRALAAREGIAPGLAKKLVDFQVEASFSAQAEQGRRARDEMRREWGRDYGRNVRDIRNTVNYVERQLPGFADWANVAAAGSTDFMRFLHWFGGQVREDSLLDGPAPARSEEMTTLEFITEAFRRAARGED